MIQSNVILPRAARPVARVASAVTFGLCATLLGCSGETINMGEGTPLVELPSLPSSSRCVTDPVLEGEIVVRSQEEVDALEGCEVIDGDLYVVAFEGAHLRALHALTEVRGLLGIGAFPPWASVEEPGEELRPSQQLNEAWLSSLEGLESLERAGSLTLNGLTSRGLEPLANLRTLTEGWLSIWSAPNLESFDGLQNLVGLQNLDVTGGARRLASFDGLTLPEYMRSLRIDNADLRQLQPLGVRAIAGELSLFDNQLRDLSAFSSLIYAEGISLIANRKLESLSGLENLDAISRLVVEYNVALTEVPDFEYVPSIDVMTFVVNPLLAKLPAFPNLADSPDPNGSVSSVEESLNVRPQLIQVYGMDALTTLTLPAGWKSASLVRIENNANLRQIDFTGQSYIEYLTITDNPLLESVSTGALDKVNVLNLAENPALPPTAFDAVRRLDTTSQPGAAP